jgi:hypothetical protein
LINRDDWPDETAAHWGIDSSASSEIRDEEYSLEKAVGDYIRKMPFLWLEVDDPPGPSSLRGHIEKNAIALLSNHGAEQLIDPPSEDWLGRWVSSSKIAESGLWNVNHVDEEFSRNFLLVFEELMNEKL